MDEKFEVDQEVMVDSPEANFSGPATVICVPNCGPRATMRHICVEAHARTPNGLKRDFWVHKDHVSKLTQVN